MTKPTIAIIGCGKQAPKHIKGLRAVGVENIVVADIAREFAEKLAADMNVTAADSIDAVFSDPSVRAVDICTPTPSHAPLIKQAFAADKDVFCEKPLCSTLHEAEELLGLAETSGRFSQVGYVYRYAKPFSWLREVLDKQALGHTTTAFLRIGGRGNHQVWKHRKETGGGAVNEMLVHMLDLANWYFGPLTDVKVLENRQVLAQRTIGGETVDVDTEDFVLLTCTGADGTLVTLQADMLSPAFRQYVEVHGTNGSYMGSIDAKLPTHVFLIEAAGGMDKGRTELDYQPVNIFEAQLGSFLENLEHDVLPGTPRIADSLELFKIVNKIKA